MFRISNFPHIYSLIYVNHGNPGQTQTRKLCATIFISFEFGKLKGFPGLSVCGIILTRLNFHFVSLD